jgi:uncharacterized protein (DUF58 family)
MQPTRCTSALSALVLGLLSLAWILDDVAFLGTGIALLFFLLYRGFLFLTLAREISGTLTFSRNAVPLILRQGAAVSVETSFSVQIDPGMSAEAEDLPPTGTVVVHGDTHTGVLPPSQGNLLIRYRISCLPTGTLHFQGFVLKIRDPFFLLRIRCSGDSPPLSVYPLRSYLRTGRAATSGEVETEKDTPLKGYGIRSFRDYASGDDPRSIDWKLTAKHGRLFVREYSGMSGKHPFLVVDLPDSAAICPGEARDTLLGSALQAVRILSREPRGCTLMVISGPNLLMYLPKERTLSRLETALHNTPVRVVQAFRWTDPAVASAFRTRLERVAQEGAGFHASLLVPYRTFLSSVKPTRFEVQCAHVLSHAGREIVLHVLSTGLGDPSHLAYISLLARRMGIEAILEIPAESADPSRLKRLASLGFSQMKVLR